MLDYFTKGFIDIDGGQRKTDCFGRKSGVLRILEIGRFRSIQRQRLGRWLHSLDFEVRITEIVFLVESGHLRVFIEIG